jgi:hypothetical protein
MWRRRVGHVVAVSLWVVVLAVALGMLAPVLTTLLVLVFLPFAAVVVLHDRDRGPTRPGLHYASRGRSHRSVARP